MKVIMCAAGKGTRISRNIKDVPKSTLPINGIPLIRINAENYLKMGYEVIVIVGYNFKLIKESLEGLKIKYYYNPFYSVTNSLASLWIAKEELNDDCIIMNADVYYDLNILDRLLSTKENVVMASDSSRVEVGDYFFGTDNDGNITQYGKNLPLEERTAEYVGLALVKKEFVNIFKKQIDKLVWDTHYDYWWENALYSLADQGYKIPTVDVSGLFWSEIDYFDDYMRIIEYIKRR